MLHFLPRQWISIGIVMALSSVGSAGDPTRSLSSEDAVRVEKCRRAVLDCQLKDGAIAAVAYRNAGQPALIEPYLANLACLGVMEAQTKQSAAANLQFVERWLIWYADHQNPDGTVAVRDGVRDSAGRLAPGSRLVAPDSHDAYMGTYLSVASTWRDTSKSASPTKVIAACRKCLDGLSHCRGPNGLYHNFAAGKTPPGRTDAQYLLDNVEVWQGLTAAERLFEALGDRPTAATAAAAAKGLAARMHEFWSPADSYFVCQFADRSAGTRWGAQPLAAEGLATVSALAFFDNLKPATRDSLWKRLIGTHGTKLDAGFDAADYVAEDPTVERVYLAALRSATDVEKRTLQQRMRRRCDELLARNIQLGSPSAVALPYPRIHRFGLMITALSARPGDESVFFPSVPLDKASAP